MSDPGWHSRDDGRSVEWWDGYRFTGDVRYREQAPAAPTPQRPPPPQKRRGGRIAWASISILVIGLGVIIFALVSGQTVKEVDLGSGKISFNGKAQPSASVVAETSPALQQRVASLEQQAQSRSRAEPAPGTGDADLTGDWKGGDGLTYRINQFGEEAVIQEFSSFGLSAVGQGTVRSGTFDFSFEALDGTRGTGTLTQRSDGTLRGALSAPGVGQVPFAIQRR